MEEVAEAMCLSGVIDLAKVSTSRPWHSLYNFGLVKALLVFLSTRSAVPDVPSTAMDLALCKRELGSSLSTSHNPLCKEQKDEVLLKIL